MRSKLPFNVYFLIVITGLVFVLLISYSFVQALLYSALIAGFIYLLFSRYACSVFINEEEIKIVYFFRDCNNQSIRLEDISSIDYEKGFYDFFSMKPIDSISKFPLYCFDTIKFVLNNETTIIVKINTRIFRFGKIIKYLKGKSGLQIRKN